MNKNEQNRVVAWRLKLLRQASDMPRSVAQTCRHFGLSRKTFYKWRARYKSHGEAGLCDRPRVPQHFPKATPRVVISKILYLRDRYHFGPGRTASYLQRFHHLTVARSTVHRILIRYGMNRSGHCTEVISALLPLDRHPNLPVESDCFAASDSRVDAVGVQSPAQWRNAIAL